jgi:SAM-dependent methyltransferase
MRLWLQLIRWVNYAATGLSIRLTRWTGKSREYIHPKHLLDYADHHWYLRYLRPGDTVLDVGCGNGMHSLRAASNGRRVIGFDYDVRSLAVAQRLSVGSDGYTFFFCGNAEQPFPLPDSIFDCVLFLDVLEHLDERDRALREIYRVLKDEGLMLLSVPNAETSWKRRLKAARLFYYSDPDHKVEYTPETLRDELARNGFEIVSEMMPIVYDTPWAGLIDLVGGISLRVYQRLAKWKRDMARRYPEESIGWRVVCRKRDVQ